MIVRVVDIGSDEQVHEYEPEQGARVPSKNDRVRVPSNGREPYVVRERHFDYAADPTVLTLFCAAESR